VHYLKSPTNSIISACLVWRCGDVVDYYAVVKAPKRPSSTSKLSQRRWTTTHFTSSPGVSFSCITCRRWNFPFTFKLWIRLHVRSLN